MIQHAMQQELSVRVAPSRGAVGGLFTVHADRDGGHIFFWDQGHKAGDLNAPHPTPNSETNSSKFESPTSLLCTRSRPR